MVPLIDDELNTFQYLCFLDAVLNLHLPSHPFVLNSLLRHYLCALACLLLLQDGALNDDELNTFQYVCFGQPLTAEEMGSVRQMVGERMPDGLNDQGRV
jgi:hypothetical protein